jgi:hypothetical protein
MAPEWPLSRMAIEILCRCQVWELALFCAAPQVPHLRHQYLKICKSAIFLNVLNIIIYKNHRPINSKFAHCIRASSRAEHAEGRGAVSISTSRMAKGTICPCCSCLSWELALFFLLLYDWIFLYVRKQFCPWWSSMSKELTLFCDCCLIEFSFISILIRATSRTEC